MIGCTIGEQMPQRPNVDLIKLTWEQHRANPTATRAVIAEKLAISVHSATNYLNHNWLAERQLGHLAYADQELQVPRSAVENEAWGFCQSGDHKWLKVALYEGHAFRVTEVIREQSGSLGSTIRDVYRVETCSFCGFSSEQKTSGYIAV